MTRTLLALWLAAPAAAQDLAALQSPMPALPLDDKVRFERALEVKAEDALDSILGPGQAKLVVDAALDFTRTEKIEIKTAEALEQEAAPAAAAPAPKPGRFLWDDATEDAKKPQILPGYPVQDQPTVVAAKETPTGTQRYERQLIYPDNLVKKLSVTLLLNRTLPLDKAETARSVVVDLLGLKEQERGDVLNVVRADFPTPWQTVLGSRESAMFVVKYGALTVMAMLGLVVLGASFFRMAGAMAAMAKTQMHQIQMDIPKAGGGLPGLPGAEGGEAAEGAAAAGAARGAAEGELTFEVKPEQADLLAEMIGAEDPANIALVVSHLEPRTRAVFLAKLAPAAMAKVLEHMSSVKFVDPDMILALKEELERRLKGTLGGTRAVLALLEDMDMRARVGLLEELRLRNPALAREVRRRTLLLEDLLRLGPDDLAVFVTSVRLDEWAAALPGAPEALRDAVKQRLPAKSWQIIEQTMASRRANEQAARQAQDRLIAIARKLVGEGRIADPLANLPELLEGAAPAAQG